MSEENCRSIWLRMVYCGSPTVILAQAIKGYGLGKAGEGRNATHQQKKLNEEEFIHFRRRFGHSDIR